MKIAPTTAVNFTAKLKKNEVTTRFINEMNAERAGHLQNALKNLDKTHPKDILEIRKTEGSAKDMPYYTLVNTKTGKGFDLAPLGLFEKDGAEKWDLWENEKASEMIYFTDVIKKVAIKGTEEYNAVFGNTPDVPLTREEKAKEKEQKAKQAVFNMLA